MKSQHRVGAKEQYCSNYVSRNYFVRKKLLNLGIPSSYMAFYFLVDILEMSLQSNERQSFCKDVYPALAKKYDKNDCIIERDIRIIINAVWQDLRFKSVKNFWQKEGTPSCKQFVGILKEYFLKDLE